MRCDARSYADDPTDEHSPSSQSIGDAADARSSLSCDGTRITCPLPTSSAATQNEKSRCDKHAALLRSTMSHRSHGDHPTLIPRKRSDQPQPTSHRPRRSMSAHLHALERHHHASTEWTLASWMRSMSALLCVAAAVRGAPRRRRRFTAAILAGRCSLASLHLAAILPAVATRPLR